MSQQNVERLRKFWETWNPRDPPDMSFADPNVTYEDTILPDHIGETYRGREGIARATMRWFEAYEELTIELDRIVDAGDQLVSIHRARGKGRHTGIEFESPLAYVWTVQNGVTVHVKSYLDPEQALKSVGLEE